MSIFCACDENDRVSIETSKGLVGLSLSEKLVDHIEKTTPLKKLTNFYKEIKLKDSFVNHEDILIDPEKSGVKNRNILQRIIFPKFHKEWNTYTYSVCRPYGTAKPELGVMLYDDRYAEIVKKSVETFCEENNINKAKITICRKGEEEYPYRTCGPSG